MNIYKYKTQALEIWLELNNEPRELWFNFDKEQITFEKTNEDSFACIGTYTKSIDLLRLIEDILITIREESYQ